MVATQTPMHRISSVSLKSDCAMTPLLQILLVRPVLAGLSRLVLGGHSPPFLGTVILVGHGIQGLLNVAVEIFREIFVANL